MAMKNDIGEIQRKNMEAAMRLAQLSIDNSQKIMALQTGLARQLFEDSVEQAKAQTSVKSPQDLVTLRARYAQDTTQRMIEAAQKIAEIGNDTRAEFSRLLTEQLAAGSHDLADAFQGFFKSLPTSNNSMLDAMQQAMATANSAFEQMAKASTAVFENMGEMTRKGTRTKK